MSADTVTQRRRHSWAELAAWRCEGEPWELTGEPEAEAFLVLLCRCGRASTEHNPELARAPAVDVLTGAKLCPGFDPVARARKVAYLELQTARVDRLDDTPP